MKTIGLAILIILFSISAYALEIAVGPNYQDLDFSGKVKSGGIEIDLEDDLGLGGDEPIGLNLRLDGGKHYLCLDFTSVEVKGAKTLSRDIQFNNKTYTATTYVESKLEYDLFEAQYNYGLIDLKWANYGISLGPLFKLSLYDVNVNIKGAGLDESYSETLPLPTLGIAGQLHATKYFTLLAQVSAIGYSGDTYIEYRVLLRIKPLKYFNFDVGYKAAEVDYSDSNNLIDLEVNGLLLQGAFVYKF